jgi:hypothetical protein
MRADVIIAQHGGWRWLFHQDKAKSVPNKPVQSTRTLGTPMGARAKKML